jgi:ankyrin repeat protein
VRPTIVLALIASLLALAACEKEEKFFLAVLGGDVEHVERAVAKGIDVDRRYHDGRTPLMWAAALGPSDSHLQIAEILLAAGADVNAADAHGNTPLMWAVSHERTNLFGLFLDAGAYAGAATDSGWSPLMVATWNGRVEAVRLLLEAGADPGLANAHDETALEMAETHRYDEIAELLRAATR